MNHEYDFKFYTSSFDGLNFSVERERKANSKISELKELEHEIQ